MTTVTLLDGNKIPQIGFGTWQSKGPVDNVVYEAVKAGYRHFDLAAIYLNQKEVGEGLKKALTEGLVKREDLWITSKLWLLNFAPENVEKELLETLKDLQLDYLDLYMPHWPCPLKSDGTDSLFPRINGSYTLSDVKLTDMWKAMHECQKKGLIKSIGVANFNIKEIEELIEAGLPVPVLNQVECHVYFQQTELQKAMNKHGIKLEAYCPLGIRPDQQLFAIKEEVIVDLAKKHGVTPAQVILQWHMKHGRVALPKTMTLSRIPENLKVSGFDIGEEGVAAIDALSSKKIIRTLNPPFRNGEPTFP